MKLGKLSLFAMAAVALVVVSCGSPTPVTTGSTTTTTTLAANQVKVVFDFTGTYSPTVFGVVPFLMGELDYLQDGLGSWSASNTLESGIAADGTGSQVLVKEADGTYCVIFTFPDEMDYAVQFKPCNYIASEYSTLTAANLWNTIGSALTSVGNYKIVVTNYAITQALYGAYTNDGTVITLSTDGKTAKFTVAQLGGWSVMLKGATTADLSLTINYTGIPSVIASGNTTYTPSTGVEITTGLEIEVLSTNTDGTTNSCTTNTAATNSKPMVITGGAAYLSTDGTSTWNPTVGSPLVFSDATTASVTLSVPSGSALGVKCKAVANVSSWDYGDNDRFAAIQASGDQTIEIIWDKVY